MFSPQNNLGTRSPRKENTQRGSVTAPTSLPLAIDTQAEQKKLLEKKLSSSHLSSPKPLTPSSLGGSSKSLLTLLKKDSKEHKLVSAESIPTLGAALPLIELIKKFVPSCKEGGTSFENFQLLSSQHNLENTLPVYDFGFERLLKPENCVVVDKIYSSHAPTVDKLRKVGVNVVDSPKWTTHFGFDESFETACAQACTDFQESMKTHFLPLIMDDGGRLAKILARNSFTRHPLLKQAVIIEQTSSGAPYLESCAAYPRVNLFGAFIKVEGEAPLVAASTVKNMKKEIDNIRRTNREYAEFKHSSFAVIGAGNMGMAIIKELAREKVPEIRVFDTDQTKIARAVEFGKPFQRTANAEADVSEGDEEKEHFTEIEGVDSAATAFQNCDIVVGATGNPIISEGYQQKNLVSRPVLAFSISSRQVDFEPWIKYGHHLNAERASKQGKAYLPDIDFTKPFPLKNGYKGKIAFMRHGTPVTFDNGPHAMPAQHAQLTRALIIGSQMQAIEIANEKAQIEKAGGRFINTDFKVSPLWQFFVFKSFLPLLGKEEDIHRYYSEELLAKMTNIESIAALSKGNIYQPFERKLRVWLDSWLKENNLTAEVEKYLDPKPITEVAATARLSLVS